MKVVDWFLDLGKLFDKNSKTDKQRAQLEIDFSNLVTEIRIRELAFNMAVNRIASAIAKCEIRTHVKSKNVRKDEWYKWNIRPNPNQNATNFWMKFVNRLYQDNEALIIKINDNYYVADSFIYDDSQAFNEHTFSSITINNLTLNKTFKMSEVFYFKQSNERIKALTDNICELYGKLINTAFSNYKISNGSKGILKIDQFAEQQDDFEEVLKKMMNEDFKTFFNSTNAVMPMYHGYEYESLPNNGKTTDTRDIRKMFDDEMEITAMAFGISKQLILGEVADTSKAVEDFLTFVIEPLTELISDEINGKNYLRSEVILGNYIDFDTSKMKHIDLFDVSQSIDKLISCGCFTINEIRARLGQERIEEKWADRLFITRNYAPIESALEQMKGGNGDG